MRSTATLRAVLAELVGHPLDGCYGYELLQSTGIKSGTLYPILDRLESEGWVVGSWRDSTEGRPPRRYYRLTAEGAGAAQAILDRGDGGTPLLAGLIG